MMERVFHEQTADHYIPEEDSRAEWLFVEAASPSMRAVEAVIRELAHSSVPVLLLGERGTGKRTLARRIHQTVGWGRAQFHTRSCRDLAPQALAPPAFRGNLTLYLDEIGFLSAQCQERLLDLLSRYENNGSDSSHVRLICGSSADLEADVRAGGFREDLYYRLSGVCLRVPPLRQRKEDVPHLVSFFLKCYAETFHRPLPTLSVNTQKMFLDYAWPGNVTELASAACAIAAVGDESVAMGGLRSLFARSGAGANGEKTSLKEAARAASREAEKELILKVLTRTRWNRRRAAQELQISYKALLYKLKQIGYGEYGAS